MAEKQKEKPIKLFDKEYKESDLTDNQKMMINHISDLDRKISSSEFNLTQLRFGRQAFVDALKLDLEKEEVEIVEE
jgi:hypothetical protein|tara:strand:- start:326 stop:553 length:228 start_codon:yes stop_codon:yes gene_type:complete